jgi:AcrR family transcriptional regulator
MQAMPAQEPTGARAEARRYVLSAAAAALAANPTASMSEIAAASGVGRATVYRWFTAREQLVEAIHEQVVAQAGELIARRLAEDGDAVAILTRLSADIVDLGDRYRWLTAHTKEHRPEDEQELTRTMERFVAERQKAGELRGDLSPQWIAAAIGGLMVAAVEQVTEHGLDRTATSDMLARTIAAAVGPG